jgi:hypothetical protein
LDDMKSVVSLLAMAPDRAQAATWASELEKNGFAHHSVEEIKKSLQVRMCRAWHELLLTHFRIRQHNHPLSKSRIPTELQEASSSQAMDIPTWDTRRITARLGKKGEAKVDAEPREIG